MAEQGPGTHLPGLLMQAPDWLDLLVSALPTQDKLSFFQSCKLLAGHVVHGAGTVTVRLWPQASGPRIDVIEQLLEGARGLKVTAWGKLPQSFLAVFGSRITHMELWCNSDTGTDIPWGELCKLRTLELRQDISMALISTLAALLEAGHLDQLQRFAYYHRLDHYLPTYVDCHKRLLGALSKKVRHLCTCEYRALSQLADFSRLHYLELRGVTLTGHALQELQVLRSLCTVKLHKCRGQDTSGVAAHAGQASNNTHKCSWETLIIEASEPKLLTGLDLGSLHKIRFVGKICCEDILEFEALETVRENADALTAVVDLHADKVVCLPVKDSKGVPVFELFGLNEPMVRLLSFLSSAQPCMLHFVGYISMPLLCSIWKKLVYCTAGTQSVNSNTVWMRLPCAVEAVKLDRVSGVVWQRLWDGLPESIVHVHLLDCTIPPQLLAIVVLTVPRHVKAIMVQHWNDSLISAYKDMGLDKIRPLQLLQ